MTRDEIQKVERYLRQILSSPAVSVRARPKKTDSSEVYVGEEFVGLVFKDDEDKDDISYNFTMAILASDLE